MLPGTAAAWWRQYITNQPTKVTTTTHKQQPQKVYSPQVTWHPLMVAGREREGGRKVDAWMGDGGRGEEVEGGE